MSWNANIQQIEKKNKNVSTCKKKKISFLVWSWSKYENDCSFYRIISVIKFCTTSVFYRTELCFNWYLILIKNRDEGFRELQRKLLFTVAETFKSDWILSVSFLDHLSWNSRKLSELLPQEGCPACAEKQWLWRHFKVHNLKMNYLKINNHF